MRVRSACSERMPSVFARDDAPVTVTVHGEVRCGHQCVLEGQVLAVSILLAAGDVSKMADA